MQIFLDSANLTELEESLKRGFVSGVTTNPSILAKEPKSDFKKHIQKMIDLLVQYKTIVPLSVEVFTTDAQEMIKQAEDFVASFGEYPNLNVKVPVGWNELEVISTLHKNNIKVNCTAIMTYGQALMAASAGADFISIFWNRVKDVGVDPTPLVRQVHQTLVEWNSPAQIIVGSIRHMQDVPEAIQAGGNIITVPYKFLPQLCEHPQTTKAIDQFMNDFKNWMS
jgi:transaldolase